MKLGTFSVGSIACLLILIFSSQIYANCGHCCMGMNSHYMKKSNESHKDHDSLEIKEFWDMNLKTINKIKQIQKQIDKEYSASNPDFDKIAVLKKKIVDHHIVIEKSAMKQNLHGHHHCWCPMHRGNHLK